MKKVIFTLAFLGIFCMISRAEEPDFVVKKGKPEFMAYRFKLKKDLVRTPDRDDRVELKQFRTFFKNNREFGVLTKDSRDAVEAKLKELGYSFTVEGTTVTARQKAIKAEHGHKFNTRSAWNQILKEKKQQRKIIP